MAIIRSGRNSEASQSGRRGRQCAMTPEARRRARKADAPFGARLWQPDSMVPSPGRRRRDGGSGQNGALSQPIEILGGGGGGGLGGVFGLKTMALNGFPPKTISWLRPKSSESKERLNQADRGKWRPNWRPVIHAAKALTPEGGSPDVSR